MRAAISLIVAVAVLSVGFLLIFSDPSVRQTQTGVGLALLILAGLQLKASA